MRWTAHEYFLLSQVDPSHNKRPVVRALADTLLEVRACLPAFFSSSYITLRHSFAVERPSL